jgi:tryptophan synthase alpha chain
MWIPFRKGGHVVSRIRERFKVLTGRGEKALVAYITGGYPSLEVAGQMVLGLAECGADIIEIGVPFSDPIADGPVIQTASYQALQGGVTVAGILEMVQRVRQQSSIPLVLMSYYNPILQMGLQEFCYQAARSGVDGLIVPELPREESLPLLQAAEQAAIDVVPLVAPASNRERIAAICARARGFVYCVSVTGITGEREEINTDLASLTGTIRKCTDLPLVIGFGVGNANTARNLAPLCDGVVVGSALMRLIIGDSFDRAGELVREIKSAINRQ